MKGDLHPAAVRLSSALPCRTHTRTDYRAEAGLRPVGRPPGHNRPRVIQKPGVGRGNNQGKRVVISGREYPSMGDACKTLRIGHSTFYRMLDDGRAVRVK